MKTWLIILWMLVSDYALTQEVDTNFHLYLLIGQSNMAGRGEIDTESKMTDPRIIMLDSLNKWVPATDPVHFDKPKMVGVGPAISFAKSMLEDQKTAKIGLVPCAWGGSSIRSWEPGAAYLNGHPYDDAIRRVRLAMQTGVLKGVLWHQGESDNDSTRALVYLEKLKILINRLRTDLKMPNLPFIAGEIGHFNKTVNINKVINQLPGAVSNTAVVSADGLSDKGDKLHFSATAARELGRRYAKALRELVKNP